MTIEDKSLKFYFKDLQPGPAGAPGVSPTVDISESENGHIVSVSDVEGTKSFEVTDGVNPEYEADPISACFFPNKKDNLVDLIQGSSINFSPIKMEYNHFVQNAVINSSTPEKRWYMITGKPRYVGSTITSTVPNNSDYVTFAHSYNYNLYCRVYGLQHIDSQYMSRNRPAGISIAFMFFDTLVNNKSILIITPGSVSNNGDGLYQFYDNTFYIPVADYIPDYDTDIKKMAIAVGFYPYNYSLDFKIDMYFKKQEIFVEDGTNNSMIAQYDNNGQANKAYSIGEYLIANNKLYETITNISANSILRPGVNIKQTSIADELKAIKARLDALES